MVINKASLYINFFIVDFGVEKSVDFVYFVDFGVDFVDFLLKVFILQSLINYIFIFIVDFGVDFVDFLLKVFILQSLINYIFIFIVDFGVDFGVEKSVDFVYFLKKSTLNIGYPMG